MIRVRKGDAEQDGGCNSCHSRGPILILAISLDGASTSSTLRLCSGCCSTLLAEVVRVDTNAARKPNGGKARGRKKADRDAALALACPLCKVKPGEKCRGDNPPPPDDGIHYSRMAEARAGLQPTLATAPTSDRPALTRVRDMAPRTSPSKRSKSTGGRPAVRKVPKPYKARRN